MHTPGPWTVRGGKSELPQVWDSGFDTCITDRVFNGNADLIAAAPDLLAACESVLRSLTQPGAKGNPSISATLTQLREAIARAKGGPQ